MNLIYYKSDIGNFGDDLNPWLWKKIFGDFSLYSDEYDFKGIGSMLYEGTETNRKQIIFGAGVRDFLYTPTITNNIDIRFVRGPISGKVFNNAKYITDAAYCFGLLDKINYKKKYKISFIPYFRQVNCFNWKTFEDLTGIKVILPTNPVEQIIKEINESEHILAAAMHGAIFADICRIPWARVELSNVLGETSLTSELKWCDWYRSMEIKDVISIQMGFTLNHRSKNPLVNLAKGFIMALKLKNNGYYLSEESVFNRKIEELAEQVEYIKNNYRK